MLEPAVTLVAAVELADEIEPLALAARNLVEVFLHLRGEAEVDEIAEVPQKKTCDRKRGEARDERLALTEDVAAALDCPDRRRVGRRPADALPLQILDERRFGISRGGQRVVAFGIERDRLHSRLA